ncbi:response regulator [Paenibacillus sp. IB182496]|uniref:Response regulator n=1 Tax=Paenibacillus sabuli TaxID=2772509 RepID=A0A927BR25_9BACL|nr:response regulator [Paenibacillus sabuli]MBD2843979.1 response regulator [Paenibacillus sabuli]
MKVLVVDDELPIREGLKALPWEEHQFHLAGESRNGKEAYKRCLSDPIDILITDIAMPVMNGLELIRSLKESKPNIQCILLTCYSDFDYAREAVSLGACDYLVKGMYREEEFWIVLDKARSRLVKERALHATAAALASPSAEQHPDYRYEIEQAIQYIDDHLGSSLQVQYIAAHVGLSSNYFGKLFHKVTGDYYQDYVKRKRMERAAELLRQTSLKIYEISEMVGIPNYRYFTECFTKHYGMNPRVFRG